MSEPVRLLCEHAMDRARHDGFRLVCGVCGSFWDLESFAAEPVYDRDYPTRRGHFAPAIGALKVRTLEHWLRRTRLSVSGRIVCEVGFGGGACLALLASRARNAFGIEANPAAIEHARGLGLRADLYAADALPIELPNPVDVWIFQDAFEHIPDPASFTDWMAANTSVSGHILLVAPRADSISRRLMGRWWPHKLPDHQFHWSRAGLLEFMRRRGFGREREFYPLKLVSPGMVVAHLAHKFGRGASAVGGRSPLLTVPFNVGELGLLLQRTTTWLPNPRATAG